MLRSLRSQIRPDEKPVVVNAFLLLFGFTTGHLLLETSRDALFLARLPASRLPWVYLAIAVVALFLVRRSRTPRDRQEAHRGLTRTLRLAAAVTLLLWASLPFAGVAAYYVLYVWTGVIATLFVVRFWTTAATTFTVGQAKRVYAVIGAGAVAGGICGAGIAAILAAMFPARHLVAAAAVTFAMTSLLPVGQTEAGERLDQPPLPTSMAAIRAVIEHPYLLRAFAVLLLGSITFTLVDYVFKSTVDRYVASASLDTFFALTYLGLNSLSLVVQVTIAGWLVRRLGVNRAMAIVPGTILCAALGVAAGGGLAAAVLLKAVDGGLRNSLHRTGAELLFVPLSARLRTRVKSVIDIVGQRGGQALASLVILLLLSLSSSAPVFAALASVAATVWLMLSLGLRQHYLDVFRVSLNDEIAAARWELPALDLDGLELLVAASGSPDEMRATAALDLLVCYGRSKVISTVLLRSEQPSVACRTLEIFAADGRRDAIDAVRSLSAHPDLTVRHAAARALEVLDPSPEAIQSSDVTRVDPGAMGQQLASLADRRRRPAARAALASGGNENLEFLLDRLEALDVPHEVRRQIPDVIGAMGTAPAAAVLVSHLTIETDGMVRFKILRALGRMRRRQPQLPMDINALRHEREKGLQTARRLMAMRRALADASGGDPTIRSLLEGLLQDKQAHALERVFRLYNLESRNQDFFRVFRGLQSRRRELNAGARELLEHLLSAEDAHRLLELVDDLHGNHDQIASVRPAPQPAPPDLDAVLRQLTEWPSASIRALAQAYERSRTEVAAR